MNRPRLTLKVLRGLRTMEAHADALFEGMHRSEQKSMGGNSDYDSACNYLSKLTRWWLENHPDDRDAMYEDPEN